LSQQPQITYLYTRTGQRAPSMKRRSATNDSFKLLLQQNTKCISKMQGLRLPYVLLIFWLTTNVVWFL